MIRVTRYPADSWIYTGVCGGVNVWVGALSTIPREHPGVNNLVLAYICILYICIFIYRLSAVRCTIMQDWAGLLSSLSNVNDWVGALSTIPIEHLRAIDVGWVSQRACMQFEGI